MTIFSPLYADDLQPKVSLKLLKPNWCIGTGTWIKMKLRYPFLNGSKHGTIETEDTQLSEI